MNEKIAAFIEFVQEHPSCPAAIVAEHFDVSTRTVRNWFVRSNREMENAAHIGSENGAYTLVVTDEQAFHDLLKGGAPWDISPSTSEQRVDAMLLDLLFRPAWITLDDFEERLYVTRRTLSTELREVEETLARYDLSLERRPHYGIRVKGLELNRRLCLAHLASRYIDAAGRIGRKSLMTMVDSVRGVSVEDLVSCLDEVAARNGIALTAVARRNLMLHATIAFVRVSRGSTLQMPADQLAHIKASSEYAWAQDFAQLIKERTSFALPSEEIAYIALHFASKRTLECPAGEVPASTPDAPSTVSDEIWSVVLEILDEVDRACHFDFLADLDLRMRLAQHVAPLAVRLKYHMDLENPVLAEVRDAYPFAYGMAGIAGEVLRRHYGVAPSEDERGYLALLFAFALERRRVMPEKHRVLVVMGGGRSGGMLLERTWTNEFSELLESVRAVDCPQLATVDFSDIDCVFTTVELDRKLPVPTYRVPFVLDEAQTARVRLILHDTNPQVSEVGGFSLERFYAHLPFSTKEDLLNFLCERALASGLVDEGFTGLVWQREAIVATTLGDCIAVPHPVRACSDETYVWTGIAEQPIVWNEEGLQVQAVFLVSYERDALGQIETLVDTLAEFSTGGNSMACLVKEQTWDCLVRLLS